MFEVLRNSPQDLFAIKGITPARARTIGESFAAVAGIANIDSWLRHMGLVRPTPAVSARRMATNCPSGARNPHRLADDIHGIGFLTADSLRNNYQTFCFHGETGEITDSNPRRLTLRMEDAQGERLVEYERDDWPQLALAYAITSHRAQGSEWNNVVVVVSRSHYMMLQRNLLYTALTRARKRAVIVHSGGLENNQTGVMFKSAL